MMKIKMFSFNPLQVNTYLIYNESNDCLIIDPACVYESEFNELDKFINENTLKPKIAIATHFHFDHLMGAAKVCSSYNIPLAGHKDYELLFKRFDISTQAMSFGFDVENPPLPSILLDEDYELELGNDKLKIIHIPGHSPCGIAIYSELNNFLIPGDILFHGSIGRTDLPGGNHNQLIEGIKAKLLVLNEETVVYPGHGPETTIKYEKWSNPFL